MHIYFAELLLVVVFLYHLSHSSYSSFLLRPQELQQAFTSLQITVSESDVQKMMRAVDLDGSGEIDAAEFEALFQ